MLVLYSSISFLCYFMLLILFLNTWGTKYLVGHFLVSLSGFEYFIIAFLLFLSSLYYSTTADVLQVVEACPHL